MVLLLPIYLDLFTSSRYSCHHVITCSSLFNLKVTFICTILSQSVVSIMLSACVPIG